MARRDARRPRRRRDRYEEYDSYDGRRPRPRQRRSGFLAPVRRFFRNVAIVLLVAIGAIIFFVVVLLIAFHFALFVQIMVYVFWVALALLAIWIIYLVVCMISAISERMSEASERKARAKIANRRADIEQERVHQAQLQVEAQEAKLAQSAYTFYEKQQSAYYESPRRTRNFREEGYEEEQPRRRTRVFQEEEPVRLAAEEELPEEVEPQTELEALGMPAKGQIFAYKDYKSLLKPGELVIGIRADGSARIGSWQDFKIMLILGASSSGKSTTVLEKCLCLVNQAGLLVVCDPGGFKPDSLIQRMGLLANVLLPGTSLAIEHEDIMANVAAFEQELERRRRGADMTTPILLVIDELNGLLMDKEIKKELTQLIEKFAQQARGYNLYMVLCAQRASGLATIRNSVISFVCHKCPEMEASKILPARYAKLAPQLGVGQTFVSDADGFLEPLQQTLISKKDISERASIHQRPSTATLHSRQTEPVPSPQQLSRVYGAPARQQQQQIVLLGNQGVPQSASSSLPQPSNAAAPKIPRRPTVPIVPQSAVPPPRPRQQRRTVQFSEEQQAASAIWGEQTPGAPKQTVLPRQLVSPLTTEELVPPVQRHVRLQPSDTGDPFDALANLRDQQQQKKPR